MVKIEVCLRSPGNGDYHAQIKGRPEIWSAGKNIDEAIGNLVRYHSEYFQIQWDFIQNVHR